MGGRSEGEVHPRLGMCLQGTYFLCCLLLPLVLSALEMLCSPQVVGPAGNIVQLSPHFSHALNGLNELWAYQGPAVIPLRVTWTGLFRHRCRFDRSLFTRVNKLFGFDFMNARIVALIRSGGHDFCGFPSTFCVVLWGDFRSLSCDFVHFGHRVRSASGMFCDCISDMTDDRMVGISRKQCCALPKTLKERYGVATVRGSEFTQSLDAAVDRIDPVVIDQKLV